MTPQDEKAWVLLSEQVVLGRRCGVHVDRWPSPPCCMPQREERAEHAMLASELGVGGESNCVKYIVGAEHCSTSMI